MTQLGFKRGLAKDLKNINSNKTAIEGTIYYTTDEKGLYIGNADKTVSRIQGSFVVFETLSDLQTTYNSVPYDEHAIYYILSGDAKGMYKYNSSEQTLEQIAPTIEDYNSFVNQVNTNFSGVTSALATAQEELIDYIDKSNDELRTGIADVLFGTEEEQDCLEGGAAFPRIMALEGNYQNIQDGFDGVVRYVKNEETGVYTKNLSVGAVQAASLQTTGVVNVGSNTVTRVTITPAGAITAPASIRTKLLNFTTPGATEGTNPTGINMNTRKITGLGSATADSDATNLSDVKNLVNTRVQFSGGAINLTSQNITKITGLTTAQIVNNSDAANKEYVDSMAKAADAMTFRGIANELPTLDADGKYNMTDVPKIKPQNGDTFKVGAHQFNYTNSSNITVTAHKGDLLINIATDDETPNWALIETGYEESLLQKLIYDTDAKALLLTDGVDTSKQLGGIKINNANNVSFSIQSSTATVGEGDNQRTVQYFEVTPSLTWESFG